MYHIIVTTIAATNEITSHIDLANSNIKLLFKNFGNKNFKFVLRLSVKCVTMVEKVVRFGVSIEPELLKKFDNMIKKEGYKSRSEKIRDLIRKDIVREEIKNPDLEAIGTLTILYDHHASNVTNKLLDLEHKHHDEIISTTHIHIDSERCLEVLVIEGKMREIQKLADKIKALKGVKQGELVITRKNL